MKNPLFTPEFFTGNRRRLRESFRGASLIVLGANGQLQKSLDSTYPFRQDSNFWYLTGVEEPGIALVMERTGDYLILPRQSNYMKTFDGEIDAWEIKDRSGIRKVYGFDKGWAFLAKKLRASKRVGGISPPEQFIEELDMYTNPARARLHRMVMEQNRKLKFIDIKPQLAKLRTVKSKPEIAAIRAATKVTKQAFVAISDALPACTAEYELSAIATAEFLRNNMDHAYEPIVAAGQNATTLHYVENRQKYKKNELILIDMGASCSGYASDISRTIGVNPTKRQQQVHKAVQEANEYAVSLVKPGLNVSELEKLTRKFLGEKIVELGLAKRANKQAVRHYYPHATSHPAGLDVHDPMPKDGVLRAGMVLTVEPGLYIKEESIGVRVEDIVLVTDDSHENLSADLSHSMGPLTIHS